MDIDKSDLTSRTKVQIVMFQQLRNSKELYILLLQTKQSRGSFWQNITGGVEKTDTSILEAAKRELQEETGIAPHCINALDLNFEFTDRWNTKVKEFIFYAIYKNSSDKLIIPRIDPREHQSFMWVNTQDVSENNFHYQNNFTAFLASLEEIKSA